MTRPTPGRNLLKPRTAAGGRPLARPPALTLDHAWLAFALTLAWQAGVLLQADHTDYWWTVKLGDLLLASGQLPTADPLAFASTREPYVEQQWAAQLILAAVHRLGGLEAALVLRGVILVLTIALLYYAARRARASAATAAGACALATLSLAGGAAIRPQLLAIPLFTLVLLGTTVWLSRGWVLVAVPLAMVVWANVHGSFPLGLALLAAALVGRAWLLTLAANERHPGRLLADADLRRLALLTGLCAIAPLFTPYGLNLLPWLVDYLTFNTGGTGLAYLSTEWLPTSIATAHGLVFFATVALVAVVLVRVGPPRPDDGLRLLGFAALALQAVRSTLWWALVMVPVLAWGATRWVLDTRAARLHGAAEPPPPPETVADSPVAQRGGALVLNAILIGLFVLVGVLSLPWLRPAGLLLTPERWPIQDPSLPVGAADAMTAQPATRVYNTLDWGGYLGWRLAPAQRIFVDGRFQLYPPELYRDYFTIAAAEPGWDALLARYRIDGLLVSRVAQAGLLRAIERDSGWAAVYCDATSAVYVPRPVAAGPVVPCGPAARD